MAKRDTSREPWIENYPVLLEWLRAQDARCDWQHAAGYLMMVEQWAFPNGRRCIITVRGNGHGWDIWTANDSTKVAATFNDAEIRMSLPTSDAARGKP